MIGFVMLWSVRLFIMCVVCGLVGLICVDLKMMVGNFVVLRNFFFIWVLKFSLFGLG